MEWYFRKMRSQDREAYINFLDGRIQTASFSNHYKWLYLENPHGEALTWLAIHSRSNGIIGCTSIFPRKIWLRDNVILGCGGGDAFVDPGFRRRGIAKELHRISMTDMREAGIKFLYGFPNSPNFGAFLKIGACYPGDFKEMKFLLKSEPITKKLPLGKVLSSGLSTVIDIILSLYIKSKLAKSTSNDIILRDISKFDKRFDKLMEEITPSFNICVIRDSNYLNWRYFQNPAKAHTILSYEEKGELHGFVALELFGGNCYLFDFFVKNQDELVEKFICAIVNFAISRRLNLITSFMNPLGTYAKNFLGLGFKLRPGPTPLMVLVPNDDEDKDDLANLENWYLTHGDYDLESLG